MLYIVSKIYMLAAYLLVHLVHTITSFVIVDPVPHAQMDLLDTPMRLIWTTKRTFLHL